ncbi:MAG TPA: IPT/TIG domain-containing protein [Nitrospira sp.]|nr:IPT/TIG domain-containing protein [Nitrospira sp.]
MFQIYLHMKRWILVIAMTLLSAWTGGGSASAAPSKLELQPETGVPGSTASIVGKGLGQFKSAQVNRVLFAGVPALIQRWEQDVVEVKVPSKAQSGPVEVFIGKKKIPAGKFTVVYPKIVSIHPEVIEPGHTIEIVGEHFGITAGPRDPNTMFGVNDVVVGSLIVRPRRWKDDKIEVDVPANATSGEIAVRLASSDPLPDGSCCAPVQHTVSNAVSLKLIPTVQVDPVHGPVGTKVVLFGQGFGREKASGDKVLIGGKDAPVAQWSDRAIVVHVPLNAESGPVVLARHGQERTVGTFTIETPKATGITPASAPIGTLLRINGEHFGAYSESGATPYNYADFNTGQNRVEIGGVPAVIYRWNDDRIDVWVPFSAKSGPVVVKRGAPKPSADGSCCTETGIVSTEAGTFTLVVPMIESYAPTSAGLDDVVTIKGSGFGSFIKTTEATQPKLGVEAFKRSQMELGENVSRTEVLFNNIGAIVESWTDTEIKARVPHRHLFGIGKPGQFSADLSTGPLVIRRGSWDLLPDGTCCTPKKWLTLEAGTFTIEAKGMPDQSFFEPRPEGSPND